MPNKARKCQNRPGKKCTQFRGKNVYYKNTAELAGKLHIPLAQARELIKDDGRRIVIGPDNNTLLVNIKDENFSGLLKTHFDIKRIDNKKVIDETDIPSKNVTITKELGPNAKGKYNITIFMYINFPSPYPLDPEEILTKGKVDYDKIRAFLHDGTLVLRRDPSVYVYNGYNDEIPQFVVKRVNAYMKSLKHTGGILIHYDFRLGSSYADKKLRYEDGYVRDFENVFELTEWANIEYDTDYNGKDTCAVRLFEKRFPELYWKIKKLETKHGIKLEVFMEFCKDHEIGYHIYNEHRKELFSHSAPKGLINCIVYNNHIYPTSGGKPKKFPTKEYELKHIDDSFKELEKCLNENKLPSKITISSLHKKDAIPCDRDSMYFQDIDIISYAIKDKKFICNEEYQECLEFLTKIGYEKHIYDNIRITDIPHLLEKIMKTDDVSSFIPEKDLFKTPALLWKTDKKIKEDSVKTVDKNKCYAYALYSLPYLIKFDYRKHRIWRNPTKIIDTFLYVARPKYPSGYINILMPSTKIYPGYFLSECKELGIEFDLLEELETETAPNYYRQFMELMYENMSADSFKSAWNIYIGKFERTDSKSYIYNYVGIYDDEAVKAEEGFPIKIGDQNLLFKETEQYLHVRDRIPIATQIKDQSRMFLYKKIKEMKLADNQLVQINTDSISYYGELPKKLDPTEFSGWKSSEFKELGDIDNTFDENVSVRRIPNMNENTRVLHMQYAGAGKTTYIINKLVPKLIKKGISYVVLAPTHTVGMEYIDNKINCEIMQKYVFNNQIPDVDYVIVDEIGFIDLACHDLLYKISRAGKSYECFGDFNQLQPVGEKYPLNQKHYLNYMFNKIDTEFINYRNNFTKEYYDELINEKIDLIKEINKHSHKYAQKAEYIICYRHDTREKYNEVMLKHLGFTQWNDVGVRIICNSNRLLEEQIYNHKQFTIIDIVKSCSNKIKFIYYLKDDEGKEFIVREKDLLSKFEPAYAINIHQAQGMTLESYYWAPEDNKHVDGRVAYTVISRLRQTLKSF